jgi:hypothetical protein
LGIEIVTRLAALLLAALATSGLMVNWICLTRAMARISSAAACTEFHQATFLAENRHILTRSDRSTGRRPFTLGDSCRRSEPPRHSADAHEALEELALVREAGVCGELPRARRSDRPKRRTVALRASVGSPEGAADQATSASRADARTSNER